MQSLSLPSELLKREVDRMNPLLPTFFGTALACSLAISISAAPLAYEPFDYSTRTLDDPLNAGGSGWAEVDAEGGWVRGGGSTSFEIGDSHLELGSLPTAGNSAIDVSLDGGAYYHRNMAVNPLEGLGAGEETWLSFLLNVSSLGEESFADASAFYLGWNSAGGNGSNAGGMVKAEIRSHDLDTGTYRLVARSGNASGPDSVELAVGATYLIAMRYVQDVSGDDDLLEIYNVAADDLGQERPTGASPMTSFHGNTNRSDFTQVGFFSQRDAVMLSIDEIRTGREFADVAPASP